MSGVSSSDQKRVVIDSQECTFCSVDSLPGLFLGDVRMTSCILTFLVFLSLRCSVALVCEP